MTNLSYSITSATKAFGNEWSVTENVPQTSRAKPSC
jgi:hypothetical protein